MNTLAIGKLFFYQLLMSLRSRESVFFSLMLPPLLFVLFGMTFNINDDYASFLLPGMIGSILASDGLYAVGPVIKQYHSMGLVRYFKNYPLNLSSLFGSFILTRMVFVLTTTTLMSLISLALFGFFPLGMDLLRYTLGIVLGFSIYSLIALSIAFFGIHDNKDKAAMSTLYFLSIFLTDAFFVVSKMNVFMDVVGYFLPLKVVLKFMREGDPIWLVACLGWLLFALFLFTRASKVVTLKRSKY